jgi:hypothetical protein
MYSLKASLIILLPTKAVPVMDSLIAAACLTEDSVSPVSLYFG